MYVVDDTLNRQNLSKLLVLPGLQHCFRAHDNYYISQHINDPNMTSTITAVGPAADKESIANFKLLIVEADTSGKWRCTNDNGVLVSDGFSMNIYTYSDFF